MKATLVEGGGAFLLQMTNNPTHITEKSRGRIEFRAHWMCPGFRFSLSSLVLLSTVWCFGLGLPMVAPRWQSLQSLLLLALSTAGKNICPCPGTTPKCSGIPLLLGAKPPSLRAWGSHWLGVWVMYSALRMKDRVSLTWNGLRGEKWGASTEHWNTVILLEQKWETSTIDFHHKGSK